MISTPLWHQSPTGPLKPARSGDVRQTKAAAARGSGGGFSPFFSTENVRSPRPGGRGRDPAARFGPARGRRSPPAAPLPLGAIPRPSAAASSSHGKGRERKGEGKSSQDSKKIFPSATADFDFFGLIPPAGKKMAFLRSNVFCIY